MSEAQRLADFCEGNVLYHHVADFLRRQDELLRQALEALSKGTSWMEHGELIAAIRAHREAK